MASRGTAPTERVERRPAPSILDAMRTMPGATMLVGCFALLLRAFLLVRSPFDGLYGQDAYFYLSATRTFEGIWTDPQKLWSWLTSPGTAPVSVWPLGYHIQMVLASLLVGTGPESGQVLSLIAGVLAPAFTTLLFLMLARIAWPSAEERSEWAIWLGAVLAGLVVAASALSVRSSVVVMADMTGAMWATLGALLVLHYAARPLPRARDGVLAGISLGIASVTRYIYPLLVVPALAQLGVKSLQNEATWRARLSDFLKRSIPVVTPVILLVGLQLLHNAIHPTPGLPSPVISNWSPLNALELRFDTADGHLSYSTPMVFFFLVRPFYAASMLGLPFGVLALIGGLGLVVKRLYAVMPLTLGWWLLFALFYSGNTYQADRFVLSYLPPLAVLTGFGFVFAYEALTGVATIRVVNSAVNAILLVIALAGLAILLPAATQDYKVLVDGKNDYLQASACLQRAVGSNKALPVLTFGSTFTVQQYTDLPARDLYYETPQSVSALPSPGNQEPAAYLLLPLGGFEAQWGNTPMGETYKAIKSRYALEPVSCPGTSLSLFALR